MIEQLRKLISATALCELERKAEKDFPRRRGRTFGSSGGVAVKRT